MTKLSKTEIINKAVEESKEKYSNTEIAKIMRRMFKQLNIKDLSIKSSRGGSIYLEIKNPSININEIEQIASRFKQVNYDQFGEILQGGNIFIFVNYSREAILSIEYALQPFAEKLQTIINKNKQKLKQGYGIKMFELESNNVQVYYFECGEKYFAYGNESINEEKAFANSPLQGLKNIILYDKNRLITLKDLETATFENA